MAARLTDRQRKKVVADYVVTQSINATAQMNGVSWDTVKRILEKSGEVEKILEQKKEENTIEALEYLESRAWKMKEAIDLHLDALMSKDKIDAATLSQISTSFGTLVDKLMLVNERRGASEKESGGVVLIPNVEDEQE